MAADEIENGTGEEDEEIDQEVLLTRMLARTLEDFALLPPENKWFVKASDWLFGELKELLPSDDREENYTIDDVCEFFGGKPSKLRQTALFMRRFNMNLSKFNELYWSEEDEGKDEKVSSRKVKVTWKKRHKSRKVKRKIRVTWKGRRS